MQSTDSSYQVPPFPAFPSTSRYVPLGSVSEALGRVCRSIDARDAISLVIGPPGTGKSLICGLLVDHYRDSHDVVLLGETPIENQSAFLRHLLHHLGADFASIPDGDLQLALVKHVSGESSPEGGLLIVVDEAQSLSLEVIESIRMVTNIMRDGEPRVLAVLCGGAKLDEVLVEPSMEAFTQRVATRCYLHPMNAEETRRYVSETIRSCGADPDDTITAEAISAIHHACNGVPRLVNQMMTQTIDCAEEVDEALITEQIVDHAWAQLQQLPSPMVEEPKIASNTAPIEFGELDESINFGELSHSEQQQGDSLDDAGRGEPGSCETGECETGPCNPGLCEPNYDESDVAASEPVIQGDLEVESATAEWVQETADDGLNTTPEVSEEDVKILPAEIFGYFEDEEELSVGSGFAVPSQPEPAAAPADLESMLHEEIVGINSYDAADQPQTHQENETNDFDDEPEEQIEDFVTVIDDEPERFPEEDADPVLWINDHLDKETGIRIADDSDILIIEDEIELQRVDRAARVDSHDQTISVDFQAMLNRMRGVVQ